MTRKDTEFLLKSRLASSLGEAVDGGPSAVTFRTWARQGWSRDRDGKEETLIFILDAKKAPFHTDRY